MPTEKQKQSERKCPLNGRAGKGSGNSHSKFKRRENMFMMMEGANRVMRQDRFRSAQRSSSEWSGEARKEMAIPQQNGSEHAESNEPLPSPYAAQAFQLPLQIAVPAFQPPQQYAVPAMQPSTQIIAPVIQLPPQNAEPGFVFRNYS